MRIITAIVYLILSTLLLSCDRQNPAADIDPHMGIECFDSHRASFPAGTQYEGIGKLADDRLTIKIMTGVQVEEIDCELNPDGTLRSTGE